MLNPIKGKMFWPKSIESPVLPSLVKRMHGRPTKKRKREPLEGKNRTKLSRGGRVMTYVYCHENRHNKLECPKRTEFVKVLPHI